MRLAGKIALISGAARGIGAAIARLCHGQIVGRGTPGSAPADNHDVTGCCHDLLLIAGVRR